MLPTVRLRPAIALLSFLAALVVPRAHAITLPSGFQETVALSGLT